LDRFRKESIWNLQPDDVVRFGSGRARVRGTITQLTRSPVDGSVFGVLSTADRGNVPFCFTRSSKVYRRLRTFDEIMAELGEPKRPA